MSRATAQSVVEDDGGGGELCGGETAVHWAAPGDVACHAGADRVTLVVHHTVGGLSAWRGMAGRAWVLEVPVVAGAPHSEVVSLPLRGYEVLTGSRREDSEDEGRTEHL